MALVICMYVCMCVTKIMLSVTLLRWRLGGHEVAWKNSDFRTPRAEVAHLLLMGQVYAYRTHLELVMQPTIGCRFFPQDYA